MKSPNRYTVIYISIFLILMMLSFLTINWIPSTPLTYLAWPIISFCWGLGLNYTTWYPQSNPQKRKIFSVGSIAFPVLVLLVTAIVAVFASFPIEGMIWMLSPFHNPNYWSIAGSLLLFYFLGASVSNYLLYKRYDATHSASL